ncbi:hypothetical protein [Streptomyces buecherae]|uniref:hypothetical protein n=1 Tax=Streptomyces buecherae TaxID=2763006 RepID=UPI0036480495
MNFKLSAVGATLLMSAMPAGVAHADETHTDSHNAPVVALISTGQIDDPMEDVLEHAAIFGQTSVVD